MRVKGRGGSREGEGKALISRERPLVPFLSHFNYRSLPLHPHNTTTAKHLPWVRLQSPVQSSINSMPACRDGAAVVVAALPL